MVLISEAGTPLVSDPGYRIVAAAIAAGARIVPVPGPSAVLAALVGAGLPTDRFLFLGFPPRKQGGRRRLFESVRALPYTLVLYESPMRAAATLADLAAVLGADRRACLARELTKPHEELVRDTLAALAARYETDRPLGEVTLVVEGAPEDAATEELDDDEIRAARRRADRVRKLDRRRCAGACRDHRPLPARDLQPDLSDLIRGGERREGRLARTSASPGTNRCQSLLSSTRKRRPGMSIDSR